MSCLGDRGTKNIKESEKLRLQVETQIFLSSTSDVCNSQVPFHSQKVNAKF